MEEKNYNIDFDDPKRIKVLGCGHTFHNKCITDWFIIQGRRTCPICRFESAIEVSDVQLGGYEKKYLKYKQKYLQLKNNKNII